jgi:WD40 repeat protein
MVAKVFMCGLNASTIHSDDTVTGRFKQISYGRGSPVKALAVSSDGKQVVFALDDGTIRLCELDANCVRNSFRGP